jgi:plasmid maintenance system antidote protein VapI
MTANTALRLARYFGTTARFWLNLQAQFDLDTEADRLGDRLQPSSPPSSELRSRRSRTLMTAPTSWQGNFDRIR